MTDERAARYAFEYPDEAGYPDGTGFLDEGQKALIDDVVTPGDARQNRPGPRSAYDIEVVKDDEYKQYNATLNGDAIGKLTYNYVGGRIVLLTAAVVTAYRHRGIAAELIAAVLDDIRTTGKKVTIICPVVRTFIDRYPEYEDLVDRVHPGVHSASRSTLRADPDEAVWQDVEDQQEGESHETRLRQEA